MAGIELESIPEAVLAWLPPSFDLETPRHGATGDVAFVVGPGPSLVIKRCYETPYTDWLVNEHRVLQLLAQTDLPVPTPIGLHCDDEESGHGVWLVMTRLRGEPLWDVVERCSESEQAQWFHRLGAMLGRIHALEIPPWLQAEPDDVDRWIERTWRRAASYLRRHMARALPARLANRVRGAPGRMPAVLMHGDFTLDNILADERSITGVIDWGGAAAGDPRWDVTLALATEPDLALSASVVAAFFEGYKAAPLPDPLREAMHSAYGWK